MSHSKKLLIVLILACVSLTAFLYNLPIAKKTATAIVPKRETLFNAEEFISKSKSALPADKSEIIKTFEDQFNKTNEAAYLDSIGSLFDEIKNPSAAAYYFEKRAQLLKTERSYLDAAYRYFDAFKSANDSVMFKAMLEHSIANYREVININPKNLDAKCDLGICLTESGGPPMEGIKMLREVVTENPNHVNAQLNLGLLSVRSGQYDKALERFENVMKADPSRTDMFVMKAQVFLQMNDTTSALENFNHFLKNPNDKDLESRVHAFMNSLEKK